MIAGFFYAQEPAMPCTVRSAAMTHRRYSRSLPELAERKKRRATPKNVKPNTGLTTLIERRNNYHASSRCSSDC